MVSRSNSTTGHGNTADGIHEDADASTSPPVRAIDFQGFAAPPQA
jgi:hypothetical protein